MPIANAATWLLKDVNHEVFGLDNHECHISVNLNRTRDSFTYTFSAYRKVGNGRLDVNDYFEYTRTRYSPYYRLEDTVHRRTLFFDEGIKAFIEWVAERENLGPLKYSYI